MSIPHKMFVFSTGAYSASALAGAFIEYVDYQGTRIFAGEPSPNDRVCSVCVEAPDSGMLIYFVEFPTLDEVNEAIDESNFAVVVDAPIKTILKQMAQRTDASYASLFRAISYSKAVTGLVASRKTRDVGFSLLTASEEMNLYQDVCQIAEKILSLSKFDMQLNLKKNLGLASENHLWNQRSDVSDFVSGDWVAGASLDIFLGSKMFVFGDAPTCAIEKPIDLTGPARIIFGGPYIHLPIGQVHVQIRLGLSPWARKEPYRVDVYSSTVALATLSFESPDATHCEVSFSFENVSEFVPVDIHLVNALGSIGGLLTLEGMSLTHRYT